MNPQELFFNTLLFVVILFPMCIMPTTKANRVIDVPRPFWAILLVAIFSWCMANMPIHLGSWTDRGAYAASFIYFQQFGYQFEGFHGETLFSMYQWIVGWFTNYIGWFYVTAIIYIGNYCITATRLTREYALVLIISMMVTFQFFAYGQNTIRAGFAASLVLLGVSLCNHKYLMGLLFFFSFFCHTSMAIPIGALIASYVFPNKTRWFLIFWFFCILVSLFAGSTFESFFMRYVDTRRTTYFMVDTAKTIYKVGFRWDFLFYSFIPIALGYYYIFILNFRSMFYRWVYNAYLIANSFWVLVIRAEFTDRFAYLSWFLFPILLMYPVLTQQFYRDVSRQKVHIVMILWGQMAFTYYMYLR